MKKISIIVLIVNLLFLFNLSIAYANIVFPAVANQFMSATVLGGPYLTVSVALLILLVETFFIKRLLCSNYLAAFCVSFAINFISSVAGIFGSVFISGYLENKNIFAYGNMRLGTYFGLIPGYVLTVLLEWVVLTMFKMALKLKKTDLDCLKTSVIMNLYSYIVLFAGILIADILSSGQNFRAY